MIVFPNAKINLGLNITEKRTDGYHNLETIFYPVPWEDALEVVIAKPDSRRKCNLYQSGRKIDNSTGDNLVVKAYNLLDKLFKLPSVDIYLYKNIPTGAGLGGGSSDAAFMLTVLNKLFSLQLSPEQLRDYAGTIGADCPFFIDNEPIFAQGTGNIFSPISLSLKNYQIVIIKPDIFVSTRDAFAQITPRKPKHQITDIINYPLTEWKDYLTNDFEESVFFKFPEIRDIKNLLYNKGAIYASMSGSGSSVYGIFDPDLGLPDFNSTRWITFSSRLK